MRWTFAPLLALSLASSTVPAAADTGTVCGTLQALRWPNGLAGTVGAATIDGQTYELSVASSSDGTNKIGRAATIGSPVCLSGDFVWGTEMVKSFVLDTCASCAAVLEAGLGPAGVGGAPIPLWIAAIAGIGSLMVVLAGARRRPPRLALHRVPLTHLPVSGRGPIARPLRGQHAVLRDEHVNRAS